MQGEEQNGKTEANGTIGGRENRGSDPATRNGSPRAQGGESCRSGWWRRGELRGCVALQFSKESRLGDPQLLRRTRLVAMAALQCGEGEEQVRPSRQVGVRRKGGIGDGQCGHDRQRDKGRCGL